MYRIKNLLLLITILIITNCQSQKKETVYILFNSNIEKHCQFSLFRNGTKKQKVKYTDNKLTNKNHIAFEMCNARFINIEDDTYKTMNSIKDLNIVDIDYLYSKTEKDWPNTAPQNIFNIYILEKTNKDNYIMYKVKWVDKFK